MRPNVLIEGAAALFGSPARMLGWAKLKPKNVEAPAHATLEKSSEPLNDHCTKNL